MYSVIGYEYLGTSTKDRCKKCGDCISLYRSYKDQHEVFFCQNCGYGFQMYSHMETDGLPKDFCAYIPKDDA